VDKNGEFDAAHFVALRIVDGRAFHPIALDQGFSGHHSLFSNGSFPLIYVPVLLTLGAIAGSQCHLQLGLQKGKNAQAKTHDASDGRKC
jgi:hypothetical protein